MPRLSKRLSWMVLAVCALACTEAIAEDAVLLASTVPGYMPGMVISSADRLNLPSGASATLLFQSGEMLRLRGPFDGTLGQQQAGTARGGAAVFADMLRMQGADATVIGGTRSTGLARPGPALDDVEVDPQRSGTYCVEPTSSVWITRPANEPGVHALRRKGSSRTLSWPAEADRIEWPLDVPIEEGSQFELTTDGTARATLTFRAIPSAVPSAAARVAQGLLLGCREQFDVELKRLSRSLTGPEVWITTDHGRRPTYHAGEAITLTIMANVDGYLYCIAAGDDGSALPLFPAGAVDGAQIRGSVPLSIPGRRQPIGLSAAPGLAKVRCWLADRDITPDLPHALLGAPTARLPDQLAGDPDSLFAHIDGTRVESDALVLKTDPSP